MITGISLLTRADRVDETIEQLKAEVDRVVVVVDNIKIVQQVVKHNVKYYITGNQDPPISNIGIRRRRIAEGMEMLGKAVNTEYVFMIEDDSVIEKGTCQKLMKTFLKDENGIGFVSGVQAGRWGVKMIGVWKVNDIHNPTEVYTTRLGEGIKEVDACGFYGFVTKGDRLRMSYEYGQFGPDVYWGLGLRRQGYRNLVDYNVQLGHATRDGIIYPDNIESIIFKLDRKWSSKIV